MITTFCLHCDYPFRLEADVSIGQRLICPDCQTEIEIINFNPLQVDWAYDGPSNTDGLLSLYFKEPEPMKTIKTSTAARCPDCEQMVTLGANPELGQKLTCRHCGAYLAVVDLNPLELDWDMDDFDSEEDWDDDDWEDEDWDD